MDCTAGQSGGGCRAARREDGDNIEKWIHVGLQKGLTNYILIEAISGNSPEKWKVDRTPLGNFQGVLLESLAASLPILCVRTAGSNTAVPLTANVDFANRDIPVLMIDSQLRPSLGMTINPADGPQARDTLIDRAIEANTARHEELWKLGKIQSYDQHDLAYFYEILNDDGDSSTTALVLTAGSFDRSVRDDMSLYASIKTAAETVAGDGSPFTQAQMLRVVDHLVEMMGESLFRALPAAKQEVLVQQHGGLGPAENR